MLTENDIKDFLVSLISLHVQFVSSTEKGDKNLHQIIKQYD